MNGRGSLQIDRRFRGIGELRRASGTKNRKTFDGINAMLTQLYQKGLHSILRELSLGEVKPLVVYSLYQEGRLNTSLSTLQFGFLSEAFNAHLDNSQFAEDTRKDYTFKFKKFDAKYPDTTLSELPDRLEDYRKQAIESGRGFVMFNRTRAMFQGMLRNTKGVGPDHSLYLAVRALRQLKAPAKRTAGLSVEQYLTVSKMFLSRGSRIWQDMFSSLCFTGMRKSEYYGQKYQNSGDRILIHGSKRFASERVIPRLQLVNKPFQIRGFEQEFKKIGRALGLNLYPRLTRKTFAMWMELADIPLTRRKLYLGHAGGLMEVYTFQDVTEFLEEDAETFQAWYQEQVDKVGEPEKRRKKVINLAKTKKTASRPL